MSITSTILPCAMTIAGSDSGGGAGIQADLKTFAALGVHGTSVITCITAQNPRTVLSVEPVRPTMVRDQLRAVTDAFRPVAAKTGMLYSAEIIHEVAGFARESPWVSLVVDPVMVASSGAVLLQPAAMAALKRELIPQARLVTPNLDEARLLTDCRIGNLHELRIAARKFHEVYGCAVLMKGGHLKGRLAEDVYWDGHQEMVLRAERIHGISTHGTGCTYSAAITAVLALGRPLPEAVRRAKNFVTQAIARSCRVREEWVLEHFKRWGGA